MRYKNYLFISLIITGLIFLSGLAHYKNNQRKIGQIIIDFKNDAHLRLATGWFLNIWPISYTWAI